MAEEKKDTKFGGQGNPGKENPGQKRLNGEEAGAENRSSTAAALAATIQTYSRAGAPYKGSGIPYYSKKVSTDSSVSEAYGCMRGAYTTPGFLRLDYVPCVGVTHGKADPINLAADYDYRTARAANSGARNYRPVDLEIVDMCVDSIVSWYYTLGRVFGVISQYKFDNLYYGRSLVSALGFDYDDLVANKILFETFLDIIRSKLEQLTWIPTHTWHTTHVLYNSTIFKDGEPDKAQLYIIRQTHFYSHEVVDEARGAKLVTPFNISYGSQFEVGIKYAQIIAFTNRLLEPLLNSDDFALIQGDIQKAWGDASFVKLGSFEKSYETPIMDSGSVKEAILNAGIWQVRPSSCVITQTAADQVLVCKPIVHIASTNRVDTDPNSGYTTSYWIGFDNSEPLGVNYNGDALRFGTFDGMLNFIEGAPDGKTVLNALAFHPMIGERISESAADAGGTDYYLDSCSTEIFHDAVLGTLSYDADGDVQIPIYHFQTVNVIWAGNPEPENVANNLARSTTIRGLLSNFDWHPMYCELIVTDAFDNLEATAPVPRYVYSAMPVWDIQNPVFVDRNVVARIQEARILSLFNIGN